MSAQQDGGSAGGRTVRRMLVGGQLRKLREETGFSRESAGYAIRASESKISRMELGRVGFKVRDIDDLLTLYGVVDEAARGAMRALADEANTPGWWHAFSDLLPNWLQNYLDLEAAAVLIRSYEVQFVPGLLQTEEYARAVILLGYAGVGVEEINRRTELRMARKRALTRHDPPHLWAVVDEAVLRRPIGGLDVMRAQVRAIAEANRLPNVRIQVIPFHAGGHAATGGAFTILRFPDRDLPDVVFIDHLTSVLYVDKREDVDQYAAAVGRLFIEADPPTRTEETLRRALQDLDAQATGDTSGDTGGGRTRARD